MLERLLENWLDSASERSYQGPFCQMLAADGHRVVHSTRHHPIEFGKDVITIAPDGVPCAFQLKGNPGGRMTLVQFREIQPQLWQLATQAIVFPGIPDSMHRSYLVTNGYVEEDVQKSVAEMNVQFSKTAPPHARIQLITRGDLLDMSTRLGARLWPSEATDLNALIRLLAHNGRDQLPIPLLHTLLLRGLRLEIRSTKPSTQELARGITSTSLLVATALTQFSQAANHYAVITAWTLFATYVIGACARYEVNYEKVGAPAVNIAVGSVVDALCLLCDEVHGRNELIEGDPFTDFVAYRWRVNLLRALLSLLWFWLKDDKDDAAAQGRVRAIEAFQDRAAHIQLLTEGAVPQILASLWYIRPKDQARALNELEALLEFIVTSSLAKNDQEPLPGPYYNDDQVIRHLLRDLLGPGEDPLQHESFKNSSWFALPIFHLLAAHGLKSRCQQQWPNLTRLNHKRFIPETPSDFCLWRTDFGTEETIQLPLTEQWSNVQAEASRTDCPEVPGPLLREPLLLMLYVIIAPNRATPNVIRWLSGRIGT